MNMVLLKDYMNNDSLRDKLNSLTLEIFNFNFEDWYKLGYYKNEYIPYSFLENNKIISNVSANIMLFYHNDNIKKYIQIGTVMTSIEYRNRNLAKTLMEIVIKEYKNQCDGIYLFGDLKALDFYKKIGFKEINQYIYF